MTALAPTNCWTSGGFERQRCAPLSGEPQILFPLPEHKPCYSQRPWQKPGQTGPARDREPGRRRGGGSLEKKGEEGWVIVAGGSGDEGAIFNKTQPISVGVRRRVLSPGREQAWGSAVTDERSERAGKPWVEQAWGNSAIEPSSSKRDRTEEFDPGSD